MSLLNALYEAYHYFVEDIQKRRVQRIQWRRELQRRVRPWLERLGDRIVPSGPAYDYWVGGFNSDWNNAGNWQSQDANHNVIAAAVPGTTTDVTIQPLAAGTVAPVIGVNANLAAVSASITDQSGTSLTINAGSSLDLTGQSQKTSIWGNSTNAPALNVNGKFQVDNLGTILNKLQWLNGNITGTGFVYVANGGEIDVEQSASNLAPNLSVGTDGINNTNQTVSSTLILSQPQATGNAMTGNLAIGESITVYRMGIMQFKADTNQNSTGGIVYAAGNTSGLISDYGIVQGTADSGGQVLTVQPQVIIQSGGVWTEVANERMKFTYTDAQNDPSVDVEGGSLKLLNGANIAVTDPLLLNGGTATLIVPSTAGVQTTTATVQGNINDNGNIQIGDGNGFAQLNVTGDVDIETGMLTMWVTFNNGAVTSTDLLNVSGKFSIDTGANPNSTLAVTTTVIGNAPTPGTNVQLVSAGSTATNSNKPFVFDNVNFNGLFYKKGTLAANGYTLTT